MRTFLNRLFGSRGSRYGPEPVRERGRPPSGNGASSLHLVWRSPATTLVAVRATVEIPERPVTSDLCFFALQATFTAEGRLLGGGHVGLQWNRRHPASTAVNWGGYASQDRGGAVLPGTESPLPSLPADPNTRDYPWQAGRRYRLTIDRGADLGWWRGMVADLHSGAETTIREIAGGGEHLTDPLVWAEVFAPCDAPSVVVHWRDLEVAREPGVWEPVVAAAVNYQAFSAGGCTNTDAAARGDHFTLTTNTARVTPLDSVLRLDG